MSARMIDREQPHLIEIDGFFQRFHETETQSPCVGPSSSDPRRDVAADPRFFAKVCTPGCMVSPLRRQSLVTVLLPNHPAINLDPLHRPRNVALAGPDPVADHARAQHVGDELVALAIPHK